MMGYAVNGDKRGLEVRSLGNKVPEIFNLFKSHEYQTVKSNRNIKTFNILLKSLISGLYTYALFLLSNVLTSLISYSAYMFLML